MATVGVVASSAGGVETLREGLVEPLITAGHKVAVTLTPIAATGLPNWASLNGSSNRRAYQSALNRDCPAVAVRTRRSMSTSRRRSPRTALRSCRSESPTTKR